MPRLVENGSSDTLPSWTYGVIGFVFGSVVTISLVLLVGQFRRLPTQGKLHEASIPLMSNKGSLAGSAPLIPQLSKRSSIHKK